MKKGDIRSFFTPKPGAGAKPAATAPAEPKAEAAPAPAAAGAADKSPAAELPAAPKPKRTPTRGAGSGKSPASGSKAKAAAAPAKPSASGGSKPAAKAGSRGGSQESDGGARAAARKRKPVQLVDSDDDDWEDEEEAPPSQKSKGKAAGKGAGKAGKGKAGSEAGDSDFDIDLTAGTDDDDDEVTELEAEEEEEKEGGKAAAKAKAPPKKRQKAADGGSAAAPKRKTPAKKAVPAAMQRLQDDAEALAAVAAVDKAAAALPEQIEITCLPDGNAWAGPAPDEPPQHGVKEAPHGHPDCLTGKTFVVTGVLESLKRGEAEDFVKRHGGKVTGSVSGRTSFLVVGNWAGRSKVWAAKEKHVKIIDEEGLFSLVRAAPAPAGAADGMELDAPAAAPAPVQQEQAAQQPAAAAAVKQEAGPARAAPGAGAKPAGGPGPAAAKPAMGSGGSELWVEKYRPRTSAELVGNNSTIQLLKHWLHQWDAVHLHSNTSATLPPGWRAKKPEVKDMARAAVLLSGPPGIGKTSSALIVCRELGYEPIEVNASDTRGKADSSALKGVGGKLANAVKELSTNTAVSVDAQGRRKRLCLIMDEVDGMSAGDRGGVADLIQTIKKTRVPIIAICNDKWSQKLKSLRGHTLELDYHKPMVPQISKRMLEICGKEGLSMNQATMDALVQSANGGDIRLILGQLQMIRLRARALSYDQVKAGGMRTQKDLEMSPFEAAKRLLGPEGAGLSLSDQSDLVFQDMDLVPLLVQENYVNHRPRIASDEATRLRIMAKAADGISLGDLATRNVRQYQNWSLMPFAAVMSSVYPSVYMRGLRESFNPHETNFPRFSAWLGQNSSQGKQKRLLGELHTRMLSSGGIECDRTGLRLSYLPVLRRSLTGDLVQHGKEGIPKVLKAMREYCIARDDLDFISSVTKFKFKGKAGVDAGLADDMLKGVETQTKAAFTREFNKQHIKPKTGFGMDDKVSKKRGGKGKGKAAAADEDEDGFGEEGLMQEESPGKSSKSAEEEEEEEEEADPVAVAKKLNAMKSKGMTLTLKDGTTKAGGKGGRGGGRGSGGRGAKASGGRGGGRGRGKK